MEKEVSIRMAQLKVKMELIRKELASLRFFAYSNENNPLIKHFNALRDSVQSLQNMIDNFENGELSMRRPLWESDNSKDMNINRKTSHEDEVAYKDLIQ